MPCTGDPNNSRTQPRWRSGQMSNHSTTAVQQPSSEDHRGTHSSTLGVRFSYTSTCLFYTCYTPMKCSSSSTLEILSLEVNTSFEDVIFIHLTSQNINGVSFLHYKGHLFEWQLTIDHTMKSEIEVDCMVNFPHHLLPLHNRALYTPRSISLTINFNKPRLHINFLNETCI